MIYDAVYTFVSLTMHFQDLGIKNKKREHVWEKIISWYVIKCIMWRQYGISAFFLLV